MKKRYLTLGLALAARAATAQAPPAPTYTKQEISQTTIRLLLSHYQQTGNHSAVTGGEGTEALRVQAQELAITHQPDSAHTYQLTTGVDVITSASTDNIDFVVSSASRIDYRAHLSAGYTQRLRNRRWRVGGQSGFSLESDYLSLPLGLSLAHQKDDGSREITLGIQAYFDDLRWGRVNPDYYRPVKLIYPVELRYRDWLDGYRRTSLNLNPALYQVINRRLRLALYPELAYQQGILSTPFHRVYFNDGLKTERVELLPARRWKLPLGGQLNWFATDRVVLRAYYRYYWDSFGLTAHTAQLEAPVRLSAFFTLSPLLRLYRQTAARYFQPYAGHDLAAEYYTSDYDLSAFSSYNLALTLRYAPHKELAGKYSFQALALRYSYYERSNQLAAHNVSLVVDVLRTKARE